MNICSNVNRGSDYNPHCRRSEIKFPTGSKDDYMLAQSHIRNNIAAIWEEITHFVTGGTLNELETGIALID